MNVATAQPGAASEPLSSAQIRGFWAAWLGWTLDGMDSFIFALVLAPALTELLPKSGMDGTPTHVVYAGSVLFAVFLAGWGTSFHLGSDRGSLGKNPHARGGRRLVMRYLPRAAALAQNVWELGIFRFLAGVGIGGEWALAGTYVAEVWPEIAPQDGSRVSADRLLRGLLPRRGAQLHASVQPLDGARCS